jgi:hypothetical protein
MTALDGATRSNGSRAEMRSCRSQPAEGVWKRASEVGTRRSQTTQFCPVLWSPLVASAAEGGDFDSDAYEPHPLHRSCHPEQLNYSLEVVGEDVQAHFGADLSQSSGEKVSCAHPLLERSKDVLDGAPA